jgi:hypothetical protein
MGFIFFLSIGGNMGSNGGMKCYEFFYVADLNLIYK